MASSGGRGPLISNEGLSLAIVVAEASIKKPAENLQPEAPFTVNIFNLKPYKDVKRYGIGTFKYCYRDISA